MDTIQPFSIDEGAIQYDGLKYNLIFSLPDGQHARLTHDSVAELLDAAREVYQQRLKSMQRKHPSK